MAKKRLQILGSPLAGEISDEQFEQLLRGDSERLIGTLRANVDADPDEVGHWLRLGIAYLHLTKPKSAAQAFSQAVNREASVSARRLYARALAASRRPDEAVYQLIQAKKQAPENPRVLRELGAAFYAKGLLDKAQMHLEQAQSINSADAQTSYSLGLVQEARGHIAEAIALYRRACELDVTFVQAFQTLADALASMGEMAQAVEQLKAALRLDRTNMRIAGNLEVLQAGLAQLERSRLIGKTEDEVERGALIVEGQLKRRGRGSVVTVAGLPEDLTARRYGNELAELHVFYRGEAVYSLLLLLLDPAAAASSSGAMFAVTIVSKSGANEPANYATAITLTFLREALGCPLTRAGKLYADVIAQHQPDSGATSDAPIWGGLALRFTEVEVGGKMHHGLLVAPDKP